MSSSARKPPHPPPAGGVHTRLAATHSTTLQEDVFHRMMSRMQQGSVSSPVSLPSLSARRSNSSKKNPRRPNVSNHSNHTKQSSSRASDATALDELPHLITSLKGALSPQPPTLVDGADNTGAAGGHSAAYIKYQQGHEHEMMLQRTRAAAAAASSASASSISSAALGGLAQQAKAAGLLSDGGGVSLMKSVTANKIQQQQQQQMNNGGASSTEAADIAERQDAVAEVEHRLFGGGPVPSSLRSVILELKQETASRLRLADVGTFRNCVQSLFECRSLIDQVLKQMPNHWHFRDESVSITGEDSSGGSGSGFLKSSAGDVLLGSVGASSFDALVGSSAPSQSQSEYLHQRRQSRVLQQAAQQKLLNEMIDECRKAANVSIPTGSYSVDPVSGRVVVDVGHISTFLLKMQQDRENNNNNNNASNNNRHQQQHASGTSSSRRRSSVTSSPSSRPDTTATTSTGGGAGAGGSSTTNLIAADNVFGDNKNSSITSPTTTKVSAGTLANVLKLVDPDSDEQRLLRQLRRGTQVASSACQTEEYMKDELTREDFDFQSKKNRELEVMIKEYEGTVQRLRNQLRIAQGALATRSGTVTYIRETLFKECSVLRTQLQVLQQYYLQHQQQPPQQQHLGDTTATTISATSMNNIMNSSSLSPLRGTATVGSNTMTQTLGRAGRSASVMSCSVGGGGGGGGGGGQSPMPPPGMCLTQPSAAPTPYGIPIQQQHSYQNTISNQSANPATTSANNNNNNNTNPPVLPRPPPYSTLALQPLAPLHSLLDTILCAVENEQTLVTTNARGDMQMEPSKDAQLRELKGQFAHQHAHWKRETADARSRYHLALDRKNEQLRKVTMASNVVFLRETLLGMFGQFKEKFAEFKQGIRGALKMQQNFMQRSSKDVEFGIAKAARDLEHHNELVRQREALKGVICAAPDLILPTLAPEFAMGYHSWSFADSNEPLKSFANAHYGKELADTMTEEIDVLHDMFVEIQRFGVRVHQLPDVHRPKPGWLMSRVAQGLLRSAQSTSEQAAQIRTFLERDDQLATQQAKVNIAIHGVIIRRKVLADRIREALREGEVECAATLSNEATLGELTGQSPWGSKQDTARLAAINATYSDIPTCASRFAQFAEDIDTYHIKRMKLQQQRMDNARQLFQLWRNSGVDVTGGRYAIVSRDPDGPWVAGLVKTRRLRGPRGVAAPVGGDNKKTGGGGVDTKTKSRYGKSTGGSPIKKKNFTAAPIGASSSSPAALTSAVSVSIVEEPDDEEDDDVEKITMEPEEENDDGEKEEEDVMKKL